DQIDLDRAAEFVERQRPVAPDNAASGADAGAGNGKPRRSVPSRAAATACSVSAAFVTSQRTAKPPTSLAVAAAAASLMSSTATRTPACAKACAVARPSPEPPPLISAA